MHEPNERGTVVVVGIVTLDVQTLNQNNEVVQTFAPLIVARCAAF